MGKERVKEGERRQIRRGKCSSEIHDGWRIKAGKSSPTMTNTSESTPMATNLPNGNKLHPMIKDQHEQDQCGHRQVQPNNDQH